MKNTLRWISKETAYLPAPVNTGFLVKNKKAVLVDSGLDRDHASKIIKALEGEGLTLIAIINTHSHADHCGGNAHLKKRLGVPVFAPLQEKAFIEQPYLEPFGLYGGAHPPAALQNKFLMAKPSLVDQGFSPDETLLDIGDFSITLIPLPGHSPQQTGILYGDVLFSADALLGADYLDKHLIPFNSDIIRHRESLQRLGRIEHQICVPAHGRPMTELKPLLQRNEAALDMIDVWLMRQIRSPRSLDDLLGGFCQEYQIGLETISQYHLYRTAFAAHLSALSESGKARHVISAGTMKWRSMDDREDKK